MCVGLFMKHLIHVKWMAIRGSVSVSMALLYSIHYTFGLFVQFNSVCVVVPIEWFIVTRVVLAPSPPFNRRDWSKPNSNCVCKSYNVIKCYFFLYISVRTSHRKYIQLGNSNIYTKPAYSNANDRRTPVCGLRTRAWYDDKRLGIC